MDEFRGECGLGGGGDEVQVWAGEEGAEDGAVGANGEVLDPGWDGELVD